MRRWLIPFIIGFLVNNAWALEVPFRSRSANGGFPGQWLTSFSPSARNAALGNASTALSGPESAYSNPAGIIGDQKGAANFLIAPLYSGSRLQSLTASYPFNFKSSVGLSFLYMESGAAEKTNDFGQSLGSFEEQNQALFLTYGRRMLGRHLDIGANFKMVRQTLDGYSSSGEGSDVGMILHWYEDVVNVGLTYQNILSPTLTLKEEQEKFPLVAKLGVSIKTQILSRPVLFCGDRASSNISILPNGNAWGYGVEVQPFRIPEMPLSFRLGINQKEYTFGFGIEKGFVIVDYAAVLSELGILHRLGLTVHFGSQVVRDEAKISEAWERIRAKEAALRTLEVKLRRGRSSDSESKEDEIHVEKPPLVKNVPKQNKLTPVMEIILFNEAKAYYDKKAYENCLETLKDIDSFDKYKNQALFFEAMSHAHLSIEHENYPDAMAQLSKAIDFNADDNEALSLSEKLKDISEANRYENR